MEGVAVRKETLLPYISATNSLVNIVLGGAVLPGFAARERSGFGVGVRAEVIFIEPSRYAKLKEFSRIASALPLSDPVTAEFLVDMLRVAVLPDFPLDVIAFCVRKNLTQGLAVAYYLIKKSFPSSPRITLRLTQDPEIKDNDKVCFQIETDMEFDEIFRAEDKFYSGVAEELTPDVRQYFMLSYRFAR